MCVVKAGKADSCSGLISFVCPGFCPWIAASIISMCVGS